MKGERGSQDLQTLRAALQPLENLADELPWAHERPWRVRTHVRAEGELLVADLHDLNARAARQAVRLVAERAESLRTGAVVFVTGVGRHSIGPGVLGDVLRGELGRLRHERGWNYAPAGSGRYALILDPARAPASFGGGLGPLFWLVAFLFGLAFAWALPPLGLPFLAGLVLLAWRQWRRSRPR